MILRLSNQSASMTYRISIRSGFTPPTPGSLEVPGDALPFEIVAIDGVVAGAGGPTSAKSGVFKSQTENEIIMMPASRADILIRNGFPSTNRGKLFELVTRQTDMSMTVNAQGGPNADVWPDIALASLSLNGPAGEMTPVQKALQTIYAKRAVTGRVALLPAPKAAPHAKREARAPTLSKADYPGCVDDLGIGGSARRIIIFDHADPTPTADEIFKLGYSKATNAPGSEPATAIIVPQPFPEAIDWKATSNPAEEHLCVGKGEEEVWELRNMMNEVHNFHIHQGKFRLATRREVERVAEPDLVSALCGSQPDSPCGADPIGFTTKAHFGLIKGFQGRVDVLHDTFPIPPASFDGDKVKEPGRVFIKIGFHADEQVGRYVYHCHILEHEDKGMMAPIEVVDMARQTDETRLRR
jgi:FtsP/CotA-like multicopper oxidase with cupredoxin domain